MLSLLRGMAQQTWLGNETIIYDKLQTMKYRHFVSMLDGPTHTLIISSARVKVKSTQRHLVDKLWLFFSTMLSICHTEIICQCGIIWSRFICWETIKQICQYLMWTMAFSMIGVHPHFDSLLMSAMWSVPFHFLTTEPKYSTWFYHWLIHWHPCWLHMPCHAEVWAIQSMRHNE
jgi:hypothetical protein